MEQLLVRSLPVGTKARLRTRAANHHRSVEAEARDILLNAIAAAPPNIVDLLRSDDTEDLDFVPGDLRLKGREVQW